MRYLSEAEMGYAQPRCNQRVRRGFVAPEPVAGHRVGVVPGHRMLFIEGHPAVEGLAPLRSLGDAEQRVLSALSDDGWPLGVDGGVARLDQTSTLRFEDARAGQVFLAGVAAVDVGGRVKPAIYGRPVETVYFLAPRSGRMLARIYDKGLESNTAPRGQLIRLENQTRFSKEARIAVEAFQEVPQIAGSKFKRRFAPLAESVEGVTAATVPMLTDKLAEMVNEGKLTVIQMERLCGYLVAGVKVSTAYAPATRKRRRRELRQHGLVLADPLSDPLEVDLSAALEEAMAGEWGRADS